MEKKQVFTTTTGSYLTTALETAQVVIPSFMWFKHVACRSAAADLPRKRPTVQQCPGHLLTPLAPISISGLAEGAILFQVLATACKLCSGRCVHGGTPEASREGHQSTQTSV